eukprot:1190685-Prymnesium_polylepis.1
MMHTPLYSPTDQGICAGLSRWDTAPSCVSWHTTFVGIPRVKPSRACFTHHNAHTGRSRSKFWLVRCRRGFVGPRGSPQMPRTAVISQAMGYPLRHFVAFLGSLRRHYAGHVILLVSNSRAVLRYCGEQRAECNVMPARQAMPDQPFRFIKYAELCTAAFDWCFTCDFRDVFFQADPFASLLLTSEPPSLIFVAEYPGKPIRNCRFNKLRLADCYGWAKSMTIWDQVCSFCIPCNIVWSPGAHDERETHSHTAHANSTHTAPITCAM